MFGRNYIENRPCSRRVPIALLILLVIGTLSYFVFHRTNFGKQILAIGDNVRAAQLSGVRVRLVRIVTFVICSVFAIIGGIMIGGYGGVNVSIGEGLEMQTIAACVVGGVMLVAARVRCPIRSSAPSPCRPSSTCSIFWVCPSRTRTSSRA